MQNTEQNAGIFMIVTRRIGGSMVHVWTPIGCIHVFGLFAQHRMAVGPGEVRRPAP